MHRQVKVKLLQDWMEKHDMKAVGLAFRSGVPQNRLSEILATGTAAEQHILRLLEATGLSMSEFVTPLAIQPKPFPEHVVAQPVLTRSSGFSSTATCPYDLAWRGLCKQPIGASGFCSEHAKERCWKCNEQATEQCDHAGQFVCGQPQCSKHQHQNNHGLRTGW